MQTPLPSFPQGRTLADRVLASTAPDLPTRGAEVVTRDGRSLPMVSARLTAEARDLWVLTLPDLRHNRRIRAFIDHVHEEFRARRTELEGARPP